ncbi:hypothetical protein SAMN04488589_2838 [Methanolobus vulcani]|jgi:hypothetical protein|uniref:Uncharacterized protein n=1 Tax=Methanolobus vulcani TaxID=38026 RepID=A0A7Z7B242_9EURY|nr:hypothetical protein [Methanolobus vulcani]MDK2947400.1 hypothetical protein [Methanolobus sp.]SDG37222.1 hypothetical protein SAMN04488589_2838 [Methanolobus vulcani]
MNVIRMIPFLKRFFLYLTLLFILWVPIGGRYFAASVVIVDFKNFFLFYLPLNFIPFIALVLATKLEKRKTVKILMIGLVLTIFFNLFIVFLQILFISYQEQLLYIYAIGRIAFPFLLWLVFTYDIVLAPLQETSNE